MAESSTCSSKYTHSTCAWRIIRRDCLCIVPVCSSLNTCHIHSQSVIKQKAVLNTREGERAHTAARGWGVWEQMINKSNETLWFIEEGRRSRALTSVNLMSRFCSFLLCVSLTSIISLRLCRCPRLPVNYDNCQQARRRDDQYFTEAAWPVRQRGGGGGDVRDTK